MTPLFLRFPHEGVELAVALVDRPQHLSYAELADELYGSHPQSLENVDVLILRPPVDQPISALPQESDLAPLRERAPNASLYVLYTHNLETHLENPLGQDLPVAETDFTSWVRSQELRAYIHRSSALLPSRPGFFYRAPSRRYYKTFLRIGNVQTTTQALDAFAFWLFPHLKDIDAILLDTWSISSIALNALRVLELHAPHQEQPRRLEILPGYLDGSPQALQDTREVIRRLRTARILVLISAVATGGSLARLREVLNEQHLEAAPSFLTLYKLSSEAPPIQPLCDLTEADPLAPRDFDFSPVQDVPATGATIFDIDGRSYFPLEVQQTLIPIRRPNTDAARDFFTAYQGTGTVRLHCDSRDLNGQRLRHHAIDLNVEAMLKTSRFRERFRARLQATTSPPTLIVAPFHQAGKELASLAKDLLEEKFGTSIDLIIRSDLHPEKLGHQRERITRLCSDDTILIIDDVSVTGQRLGRYQKHLRDLEYRGRIHFLIGVARPPTEEAWNDRQRHLRYRSSAHPSHQTEWLEKVLLPDWAESDCPWCRERKILTQILNDPDLLNPTRELVAQRAAFLDTSASDAGLVTNVFWRPPGTDAGAPLTMNSIYLDYNGNASEADVVATVAAAIQFLRTTHGTDRIETAHPHVSVIDPDAYLGTTTFTDTSLRLAILRTAKRSELALWQNPPELKYNERLLDLLFQAASDQEKLQLELSLALFERKVVPLQFAEGELDSLDGTAAAILFRYALSKIR
jgi:hypothetical protein